ncbi:MAG: Gfo/Idh/MocA family oxidoreductase [Armatimonadota bacterium]|nr:Gfo/Idh/MocA family oxidoreductase [Armatimonadota bacterium]
MSEALRIGIVGAGKIGKQHAKWYLMSGCQVVGFVGSTPESVARTGRELQEMLGVEVPGFTSVAQLVAQAHPAAVSVCSPHALHCRHTLEAVEAGLHVLCEKPLVWDDAKSPEEMLRDARRMCEAAAARGVILGMNAQYVAGIPAYQQWYEEVRGPLTRVEQFEGVMQSRGRGGGAEFEQIWVDLGSHPISLILKWSPGVQLDSESISCQIARKEVIARFRCVSAVGNVCHCEIRLGNVPEGALQRRFGANGFVLDVAGRNDAQGVYRAYLSDGKSERECPDFMHTNIAEFVRAVRCGGQPLVGPEDALRNLEWQLEILRRATRVE